MKIRKEKEGEGEILIIHFSGVETRSRGTGSVGFILMLVYLSFQVRRESRLQVRRAHSSRRRRLFFF
jgi:hypothetical protein